jgi:hypothetical protein
MSNAESQFHQWQGASGNWYVHTVFSLWSVPVLFAANYMFVARGSDGRCRAIYIGQSSKFYSRFATHEKFWPAVFAGSNEVHVHLLADSDQARFNIETDLRRGHSPVLNEQSTGDLFGLNLFR